MEENNSMKLEVEEISTDIVKPSTPTSSLHKSFNLCFLDQFSIPIQVSLLLVYTNSPQQQQGQRRRVDTNVLKKSLAQTLTHFYPLAGRVVDGQHVVSCKDEGIPFIETRVNCNLSTFLSSPRKLEMLNKFYPTKYNQQILDCRPISEIVQLAFQVNVFNCGGFAIGCYMFHKLLDATSMANFLKYWSALTNEHYDGELTEPDFATPVVTFPPSPKIEPVSTVGIEKNMMSKLYPPVYDEVVTKSFLFNRSVIEELKSMAASEELPKPTGFEAVAGFVWEHAFAAACAAGNAPDDDQEVPTWVTFATNVRGRTNPPLPKDSMGNLITLAIAKADEKGVGIDNLAARINAAISTVKTRIDSLMPKIAASEVLPEEWDGNEQGDIGYMLYTPGCYNLTSWCNLGFNEADFGFGKPDGIVPGDGLINPMILRNYIILTDYYLQHPCDNGYGVEVSLYLAQKEMFLLESNPQFLAYASPR